MINEPVKKSKLPEKKSNCSIILKGQCASGCIVSGAVKILADIKDFEKIDYGDIIVVKNLTPDLIKAVKKSGAVIADGGSLLCHAAIVSKDLNIPCLVGTKKATSVLKEGDIVEVNANNGCVTIIKKK